MPRRGCSGYPCRLEGVGSDMAAHLEGVGSSWPRRLCSTETVLQRRHQIDSGLAELASVRLTNLRCQPGEPCARPEVLEIAPPTSVGGCMVSSFWDA